jgi:hypothetical protein
MTSDEKKKIYAALSAPFSEEAIQRTEGRVTGRGYDTTGVGYQFIANRLNEVLGIGSWRTDQKLTVRETTTAKGRAAFDATCDVTLQFGEWVEGKFLPWAEAFSTGGHQSLSEADARKGAFTNGIKKAAAMMGCGKQAYEGSLDDDNVPSDGASFSAPVPQSRPAAVQQSQARQEQQPTPQQTQPRESAQQQAPSNGNARNRLSSKQLAAIWALARKLNYNQADFRKQVRSQYNAQPEFLDKTAASDLIGRLSAKASNGGAHPAGENAGQAAGA